jgi:very-short-patch-repair endonuclease
MDVQPRARGAIDRAIAAIAATQHGLITRKQLLDLGLGRGGIEVRLRGGRLQRIHRGVYAVGHANLTREGRWLAAVLAGGSGAVLSHRSAAELWGLFDVGQSPVHVTTPISRISQPGIRSHEARLSVGEIAERSSIPVTSPTRTLLDLAAVAPRHDVARALREAEARRPPLLTAEEVLAAVERRPRRRGNSTMRAVLADAGYGRGISRSALESRFRSFLRRHGLPPPARNVHMTIGALEIEADCVWHEQRLIVELDGRAFHDTAAAFESDRARDRALAVHGWTVIRVTWRQLKREERQLARDLRAMLGPKPARARA